MGSKHVNRNRGILLAASIAAVSTLLLAQPASAQFSAGQDGHANDANNRKGSNGYNGTRGGGNVVTPNDIVNRNVTGGREFRGPVLEKDPRAFTGPSAGRGLDIFDRQTNGVPTNSGAPQSGLIQPQPYYGETRFANPPSGALPDGFTGGYIGTTLTSPSSLSNGLNTEYGQGLQARTMDRETLLLNQSLNPSGYGVLTPGQQQLGNSIVLGTRTMLNGTENFNTPELPDRTGSYDEQSVLRMRQELREAVPQAAGQTTPKPQSNEVQPVPGQSQSQNQPINQSLNQPFDVPANAAISAALRPGQMNNDALSSSGTLPASARERPSLVPPQDQSSVLSTLQQRLERSTEVGKAMADARVARPQPAKVTPGPGRTPGAIATPPADQGPVQVSSLATGIRAKGLHDLLAASEDLMRDGKFDSAIQKYNQAQRVAPNNPLISLGRANAELGGGYYARAEQDLRGVFRNDPELLLAQFDLAGVIPKERMQYIRKDLADLARIDPKAETPWFLLAYLDYNTGNAAGAEQNLNEADRRAARGDWAVRLLRQHWTLPSSGPGSHAAPSSVLPSPAQRVSPATNPAPAVEINK